MIYFTFSYVHDNVVNKGGNIPLKLADFVWRAVGACNIFITPESDTVDPPPEIYRPHPILGGDVLLLAKLR